MDLGGCEGCMKWLKDRSCRKAAAAVLTAGSVMHIVEEAGGIDRMIEVDSPTDSYYDKLREDLEKRFPEADNHVLDHLVSLEAFLDRSIVSGFSFGAEKAQILVQQGKLLGHEVGVLGRDRMGRELGR